MAEVRRAELKAAFERALLQKRMRVLDVSVRASAKLRNGHSSCELFQNSVVHRRTLAREGVLRSRPGGREGLKVFGPVIGGQKGLSESSPGRDGCLQKLAAGYCGVRDAGRSSDGFASC